MLLIQIVDMYSLVVFAAVIISWIRLPPNNPIAQFVNSLTEPLLDPIRRMMPDMGGLDFSPMILLIALQLVKGVIAGAL
jgi:YggT family protein